MAGAAAGAIATIGVGQDTIASAAGLLTATTHGMAVGIDVGLADNGRAIFSGAIESAIAMMTVSSLTAGSGAETLTTIVFGDNATFGCVNAKNQ